MLTQLFVNTARCGDRDVTITGDRLAAGVTEYADALGASPSAEWRMQLQLDDAVVRRVLDVLSGLGPKLADIVTAGRDPDSPPGRARAEALKELDDPDDED